MLMTFPTNLSGINLNSFSWPVGSGQRKFYFWLLLLFEGTSPEYYEKGFCFVLIVGAFASIYNILR